MEKERKEKRKMVMIIVRDNTYLLLLLQLLDKLIHPSSPPSPFLHFFIQLHSPLTPDIFLNGVQQLSQTFLVALDNNLKFVDCLPLPHDQFVPPAL